MGCGTAAEIWGGRDLRCLWDRLPGEAVDEAVLLGGLPGEGGLWAADGQAQGGAMNEGLVGFALMVGAIVFIVVFALFALAAAVS